MTVFRTDLQPGDTLSIDNDRVRLTLESKTGQVARFKVEADRSIPIRKNASTPAQRLAADGLRQ